MTFPYYRPETSKATKPILIPFNHMTRMQEVEYYVPDAGLASAVNAALMLGQPLLLTGEPGVGKTQLAYHVSAWLGYGEPHTFGAKSTSIGRDLFYTFDALSRFHDATVKESHHEGVGDSDGVSRRIVDGLPYVKWEALGAAILQSLGPEKLPQLFFSNLPQKSEASASVVLVDEIDKAPRDFPNDLLNELGDLKFSIPELGGCVFSADDRHRPVVIITSNSDKSLPDAFLRRCIYYDIPFPGQDQMLALVSRRPCPPLLDKLLDFFYALRQPSFGLIKKPATAELLGWLNFLFRRSDGSVVERSTLEASIGILVKTRDDQLAALEILQKKW